MGEICNNLHRRISRLEPFNDPQMVRDIPANGIYFLYETGEDGHDGKRIVRAGTHVANGNLQSRLAEHFNRQRRNKSIFRKNIGRAILGPGNNQLLGVWNSRTPVVEDGLAQQCQAIEDQVTDRIQRDFTFVFFQVNAVVARRHIEKKIIATVAQCTECKRSKDWFGLNSPIPAIRNSGLWNVQGLNAAAFTEAEYHEFEKTYFRL